MRNRTTLFALLLLIFVTQSTKAQTNWWDAKWFYRLPISIQPINGEQKDAQAKVLVNFTTTLKALNIRAGLDTNSMRLVEINSKGEVLDDNVVFQFTPERDFHASKKAQGTLTLLLKGKTTNARNFQLYFDTTAFDNSPQPLRLVSNVRAAHPTNEAEMYVTVAALETRIPASPVSTRKTESEASSRSLESEDTSGLPSYLSKPEHRFFAGYCTWYAARKWKEFTGTPVTWHGDGGSWFAHAAAEGRKVSSDPKAAVRGAVIVWTRVGQAGHVAFVEEVTEEGIRISEMNAHGLWVVSDAFLPFSNLDKGTKYKFKGYVLPE